MWGSHVLSKAPKKWTHHAHWRGSPSVRCCEAMKPIRAWLRGAISHECDICLLILFKRAEGSRVILRLQKARPEPKQYWRVPHVRDISSACKNRTESESDASNSNLSLVLLVIWHASNFTLPVPLARRAVLQVEASSRSRDQWYT